MQKLERTNTAEVYLVKGAVVSQKLSYSMVLRY